METFFFDIFYQSSLTKDYLCSLKFDVVMNKFFCIIYNYLFLLIVLIFTLFSTACYYTNSLTIEVLQYPNNPLPKSTNRIAFIDKTCPPNRDTTGFYYYLDHISKYSDYPADSTLSLSLINGLKSTIHLSGLYEICDDTLIYSDADFDAKSKSLNINRSINADILISLEKLSVKDETIFYYDYLDQIHGDFFVGISAKIGVYSLKTKQLIKAFLYSDTIGWRSYALTAEKAYQLLPKRYDALPEATFLFGQDMAKNFSPYWSEEERMVYSGRFNDMLRKGADAAMMNNWERAKYYWKEIAKLNNKHDAATAFYNLAVYEEVMGNIQEAILYAEKAMSINKHTVYEKYLNLLKKEKQQIEYLDKLKNNY